MSTCDRRRFLKQSLALAAALPMAPSRLSAGLAQVTARRARAVPVALARCRSYADAEVHAALKSCIDLVGGITPLVKGKTVTVKVNLTGQDFSPFLGLPVGETYMTHYATVYNLSALLFGAGARRVRLVESTNRRTPLEPTLVEAGWDLTALGALGTVVYENTRNRGSFESADLCAARPVDLAIIDGITSINRGESRYSAGPHMRIMRPGVLIVGTNPVSVDAVGTSIMGFDPRASRGTGAFAKARCENHLLLAEQKGLGTADLQRIDIRGLTLDQARHPYA